MYYFNVDVSIFVRIISRSVRPLIKHNASLPFVFCFRPPEIGTPEDPKWICQIGTYLQVMDADV